MVRGCNVNVVNNHSGYTALHYACNRGSTECVKELLDHGADTSIKKNDGDTPLDVAHRKKHQDFVALLVDQKIRRERVMIKSYQDMDKKITNISEMSTPKDEVSKCVALTMVEHLSSNVSTIIGRQCDELKRDIIVTYDEKMKVLTRNLEAKIEVMNNRNTLLEDKMSQSFEKLSNQLSISNSEDTKCISDLSSLVGHLNSKFDLTDTKVNRIFQERKMTSKDVDNAAAILNRNVGTFDDGRSQDEDYEKELLSVLKPIKEELEEILAHCHTILLD